MNFYKSSALSVLRWKNNVTSRKKIIKSSSKSWTPEKNIELTDHKSKGRTDISDLIGLSVYGDQYTKKNWLYHSSGYMADAFKIAWSFSAMPDQTQLTFIAHS